MENLFVLIDSNRLEGDSNFTTWKCMLWMLMGEKDL
jgi:hypothetical protein